MMFYSGERRGILDSLQFLEAPAFQLGTGKKIIGEARWLRATGGLMAEAFTSGTGVDTC